jgi:hypothetical protein
MRRCHSSQGSLRVAVEAEVGSELQEEVTTGVSRDSYTEDGPKGTGEMSASCHQLAGSRNEMPRSPWDPQLCQWSTVDQSTRYRRHCRMRRGQENRG